MREIQIEYNPYRVETKVLIDGIPPRQNSRLNVGEKRLQEWIEDLPGILCEECSTREFHLNFHGTLLDYEDVESAARDAEKGGIQIKLTHTPAKEVADKEKAIAEIFSEIQKGPFEELKQKDIIRAFNLAMASDFEVNVIATMSAGKSTLINALLRQKLMPAKQEACTATITELKDNDKDFFSAKVYHSDGTLLQTHSRLTFEIMEELNSNREVSRIRAEGNIPFVTADDVSLVLVDTPGPNNSRDPDHQAATYRMLSESSKTVVLYIMNATQLAVNDDYNLLSHVASSMRVGGKQSRDRFIFVLNKLDDFRKGEDSVQSALNKVRDYLKDNGIENPNIYPASALTALDIRTTLAQSDDDDNDDVYAAKGKVRKFNRNPEMHFEKLAPLTPSARGEITARLAEARESQNANEEALIHCGVVPIEMAIQMYVRKYAKTAKIKNIVDTFSKRLESAKSFETTKDEIRRNQEKQKEILKNIEDIRRKLENGENAKKFRQQIQQINYDREIKGQIDLRVQKMQERITAQCSDSQKISIEAAEALCTQYGYFSTQIQAEFQVDLEKLIDTNVRKSANDLLNEYRKKLSSLASEIHNDEIGIDPFEMMQGDISGDASTLISSLTETESVKVDEVWVANTSKKWYKPWTWFQEKGHWRNVYEDREYIETVKLSQQFFAPLQQQLYENGNAAIEYAKQQTQKIKDDFSRKFDELDAVLKRKLQELEECANDNRNVEQQIRKSRERLDWLKYIQSKTESILDI